MFLSALNEEEKRNFLRLAVFIAKSDEEYAEEEKKMIEAYKYEMNLDFDPDSNDSSIDVNSLIESFNDSDEQTIKKIFIELIGLVLADEKFVKSEKEILQQFMEKYSLSEEYLKQVQDWIVKLNALYAEGATLIKQ